MTIEDYSNVRLEISVGVASCEWCTSNRVFTFSAVTCQMIVCDLLLQIVYNLFNTLKFRDSGKISLSFCTPDRVGVASPIAGRHRGVLFVTILAQHAKQIPNICLWCGSFILRLDKLGVTWCHIWLMVGRQCV